MKKLALASTVALVLPAFVMDIAKTLGESPVNIVFWGFVTGMALFVAFAATVIIRAIHDLPLNVSLSVIAYGTVVLAVLSPVFAITVAAKSNWASPAFALVLALFIVESAGRKLALAGPEFRRGAVSAILCLQILGHYLTHRFVAHGQLMSSAIAVGAVAAVMWSVTRITKAPTQDEISAFAHARRSARINELETEITRTSYRIGDLTCAHEEEVNRLTQQLRRLQNELQLLDNHTVPAAPEHTS